MVLVSFNFAYVNRYILFNVLIYEYKWEVLYGKCTISTFSVLAIIFSCTFYYCSNCYCSKTKAKTTKCTGSKTPSLTLPMQKQPQKFSWTFLFGKASREWLNIIAAFAIPIVVVAATLIFNNQQAIQQTITNKAQHDSDAQIAQDQQRETTLNTYFHVVEGLLLDRGLQTSKKGDEVRVTARIETLLALQRLDGNRRGLLMQFLSEAKLVTGQDVVINLTGAELANAYLFVLVLQGARLDFVDLQDAVLKGAHLQNIHLKGSHLQGADFRSADLQGADLRGAHMFTDLKESCL